MKTILVPTDFSEAANNAADYAANFAKEINAKVLLFHVYHMPTTIAEVPIMIITPAELLKENEALLNKEVKRLTKKGGVEIKHLAKMGFAIDEILKEEKNADFIVMGMKGANKLSDALMGSITTEMLRKANIPILVIPEKAHYKKPEKIVFACDYNPKTDAHALDALKMVAKTIGSKIDVLNIKHEKSLVQVEEAVERTHIKNELNGIEHVHYFYEKNDLAEGINEFVKVHHADLVALIPHRYNLMERLFHKSISKKMVFHSHVPMLCLPDNHKSIPAYFF